MKTEVLAMPYRIGPNYVPEVCATLANQKQFVSDSVSKVVAKFGTTELSAIRTTSNLVLYVVSPEGGLYYYMELYKVGISSANLPSELANRAAYQGSVWRDPVFSVRYPGFASLMFWKYLCSHTRSVISDSSQSDAGEDFWKRRMVEAFDSKHKVYEIKCSGDSVLNIESATELLSYREADTAYSSGRDYSGWHRRLAIVY